MKTHISFHSCDVFVQIFVQLVQNSEVRIQMLPLGDRLKVGLSRCLQLLQLFIKFSGVVNVLLQTQVAVWSVQLADGQLK